MSDNCIVECLIKKICSVLKIKFYQRVISYEILARFIEYRNYRIFFSCKKKNTFDDNFSFEHIFLGGCASGSKTMVQ